MKRFSTFGAAVVSSAAHHRPAAGAVTPNVPSSATLGSVFCIATTSNGLVDFAADLPGPGAVSLPGTFNAQN
jgi:hypothetical protein